jgi:hypothetical protein
MRRSSPLKYKFMVQRRDAKYRGIAFLFTFEEWLQVWTDSGHLHERGSRRGQYVMARYGDVGPYSKDNVKIITAEENHIESGLGRRVSLATRAKMSESGKVKFFSRTHRENLSRAGVKWHWKRLRGVV